MPFVKLNFRQINRISETFNNVGLLLLASMSIPVFSNLEKIPPPVFLTGVLAFAMCLLVSLLLIGGESYE